VLPGTAPLTQPGDLAEQMEEGIQRFLRGRIEEMPRERARLWQRDYRSAKDYEKSVSPSLPHLAETLLRADRGLGLAQTCKDALFRGTLRSPLLKIARLEVTIITHTKDAVSSLLHLAGIDLAYLLLCVRLFRSPDS
jgi:hypothetical protein